MARIPLIENSEASPEVLSYYDRVAAWLKPLPGPRATQAERLVPQPWRLFAHSPDLANVVFEALSFAFSKMQWPLEHLRQRQLVILTVIRRLGCEFAYTGHWPTSERAGIARPLYDQFATLEGMEAAKASPLFTEEERLLIRYADDLVRTGHVAPDLFDQVQALYGPQGTLELTAVIGFRMFSSVMLNAFDIQDD